MANISISGSGHNSTITLYKIHQGQGSFRKDTATTHSQVALMQQELTNQGYSTQGVDGKFGNNTFNAVKAFQRAEGLTVDGYFGKNSLNALEANMGINVHLDPDNCQNSQGGESSSSAHDTIDGTKDSSKYKYMRATRVNSHSEAIACIQVYSGSGIPLTVSDFSENLYDIASVLSNRYSNLDCANYIKQARNGQGGGGSTTNFTQYTAYFGYINDLGGYDCLIPGMEIYQGCRKASGSSYYYTSHIGVYAGKVDFNDGNGPVHAVYQSSSGFGSLPTHFGKTDGPDLSKMNDRWNYWGWSKYILL